MKLRINQRLLAVLVLLIISVGALSACGSSSNPSSSTIPATTTQTAPAKTADGCPAGTTIPQGGGDQDGDNSGAPTDGNGCM